MIDIRHFSGQQAGEEIGLFLRRHPLALIWYFRLVALVFLAYVVALAAFADVLAALPAAGFLFPLTLAAGRRPGPGHLWVYAVWYYDIYMVTDQRLLDFARKPLIYERRDEAQLSKVQDIRVDFPNPLALLLDFGDVKVQTAGSRGAITCSLVPRPRQVQARILSLAAAAQQRAAQAGAAAPGGAEADQMRQYLGLPPGPTAATGRGRAPPPGRPPCSPCRLARLRSAAWCAPRWTCRPATGSGGSTGGRSSAPPWSRRASSTPA